eukprot:COSAG02_NODE_2002_length_10139_cov_4.784761_8_plen_88_part_00
MLRLHNSVYQGYKNRPQFAPNSDSRCVTPIIRPIITRKMKRPAQFATKNTQLEARNIKIVCHPAWLFREKGCAHLLQYSTTIFFDLS